MANATTMGQRLAIGIVAVLLFLLVVLGGLGLVVLLVWPWWVVAAVAATALILAIPVYLLRRLFAPGREGFSPARSYVGIAVVVFLAVATIVAFPVYWLSYLVDARPTLMPLATLTDGKKTVQFQGMQHVGSEGFYKSVVYDLREALANGYRLFYEGVKPVDNRPDLTAWFNGLATEGAGSDLSTFYKMMADGCGMQFQLDYFKGLLKDADVHPDRHYTADVTYLELKTEYDRLMREDADFARAMSAKAEQKAGENDESAEAFKFLFRLWQKGTADQKRLLGLACRGFFSWSFSQESQPSQKDKLILDYRNKVVARAIAEATDGKIWVTYGAHHLTGIVEDLKKIDPAWRIVSVKWSRAITNPEERQGELR